MESVITTVAPLVPTAAWPIIIVVLGCAFIYYKIKSERKATKTERDNAAEQMNTRVTLLEHDCDFMKQQHALFGQKLDRILEELTNIKVELAKKEDK